ncbi:hypothetical protein AAG906_011063 [Vitis piasezkii]
MILEYILMDPGPVDRSVLYNQEVHRSLLIWEGNDPGELHCRCREASFYLNINGSTCLDWREVCATLLGVVPENKYISGQRLHLTWLTEHFPSLAPDADVEFMRCYARAFILQFIGELGLHKYDLRGRHDLDWMSIHHHYIQRWEARYDHLARAKATSTSYGYNHPYMVWYRSITHLFLTPHESAWEIVVITIYIVDWSRYSNIGHRDEIHQLCATTLEAIQEADRLLIPPNVVDTERQSSDKEVVMRDGRVRTRGGGVHTRGGGVRTRSGSVQTRGCHISNDPHFPIDDALLDFPSSSPL